MIVCCFFILGLPTETQEELQETAQFALRAKLDMMNFSFPHPYPNTELYEIAKAKNKKVETKTFEFLEFISLPVNLSEIPTKKLFQMQKRLYWSFYLNPRRIFRFLLKFHGRKTLPLYLLYFAKSECHFVSRVVDVKHSLRLFRLLISCKDVLRSKLAGGLSPVPCKMVS